MKVNVFRIEYDLVGNPWSAKILGDSTEDAVETLLKWVKNAKVKTISNDGAIHEISEKVVEHILKVKKIKKDKDETTTETASYICPWCEKPFEKAQGLKIHLLKMHNVKENKTEE